MWAMVKYEFWMIEVEYFISFYGSSFKKKGVFLERHSSCKNLYFLTFISKIINSWFITKKNMHMSFAFACRSVIFSAGHFAFAH